MLANIHNDAKQLRDALGYAPCLLTASQQIAAIHVLQPSLILRRYLPPSRSDDLDLCVARNTRCVVDHGAALGCVARSLSSSNLSCDHLPSAGPKPPPLACRRGPLLGCMLSAVNLRRSIAALCNRPETVVKHGNDNCSTECRLHTSCSSCRSPLLAWTRLPRRHR